MCRRLDKASFLRDLFCRRRLSSSPLCLRQSRRKRFATTASPTTLLTTVVVVVLCSSPSSFGAFSPRTKTVSRRRCTFVVSTQKNLLFCVEIFPTKIVCRDILGVHISHATLMLLFVVLLSSATLSFSRTMVGASSSRLLLWWRWLFLQRRRQQASVSGVFKFRFQARYFTGADDVNGFEHVV